MEKKSFNDVHIGRVIKIEMDRQGRKASWLATQLHCDRTNVYKIYERKSIDSLMLVRIGAILSVNFWEAYLEWKYVDKL